MDKFAGERFLVGEEFLGVAEGDAAAFGGDPAVVGAAEDEGAFELGDTAKQRSSHRMFSQLR